MVFVQPELQCAQGKMWWLHIVGASGAFLIIGAYPLSVALKIRKVVQPYLGIVLRPSSATATSIQQWHWLDVAWDC